MTKTLPFPQGGASDGAPPPGPATPLPGGTEVAHLVIDRVLHEGPHTIVYLAHEAITPDGGAMALMEYFPRTLALRRPDGAVRARQAGDAIAVSVAREAFVQDANALEHIEHPNLVRVLGSLQAHGTVYRAMAYVEGPTLERHVLAREGPARVGDIVRLVDALLDALDALHQQGVIHGNVRPEQILLAGGHIERPVLLGMGSAAAEIAGHEAGPWAAPEQSAASRHDRINSATDLYMLAATAWFAATGEEPPALRERLAHPEEWDPREALADLTEGPGDAPGAKARLARTLAAALELLPSARPQRVDDLRGLLHPSAARPGFESSGSAPLWVGQMPDREAQWEVVEMAARGVPPPARPAAARSRAAEPATPRPATVRAGAPSRPPPPSPAPAPVATTVTSAAASPRPAARQVPRVDDDPWGEERAADTSPPAWSWRSPLVAVLAATAVLAIGAWFVWRPTSQVPVVAVPAPPAGPSASGVVGAPVPPRSVVVPPETMPAPAPAAVIARPASPAVDPGPAPTPAPRASGATPSIAAAPAVIPPPPAAKPVRRAPSQGPTPGAKSVATAAAPPRVASPRPPPASAAGPRALCGNASGFSLAYCLQEECAKAANRGHPRCAEWRSSTEAAR